MEAIMKSALLYLSTSEGFKNFLTKFKSFNSVTQRFVAGEEMRQAVEAIKQLNAKRISATFDHLGESISAEAETREEVHEYQRLIDAIAENSLDSNVSVKLTQLGLDIDPELCYRNTRAIVETARQQQNFVRIDMEDSTKTDATFAIFKRLRAEFDNVGIVVQAYLYRTEKDVEEMLRLGARIRLCKGAYKEPESVAFPDKADVDQNYIKLMKMLLPSGIYHGIATHDPKMIEATKVFARDCGITADRFEFQMLYGIRRDLQESLVKEGWRMRVYVPYGKFWYPYFMRRLAERPANVWFVLKNIAQG